MTFHGTFAYELLFVGKGGNGDNGNDPYYTNYNAGDGGGAGSYMSCQYQSKADDVMRYLVEPTVYTRTLQQGSVAFDLNWQNYNISYTTNRIDDYIYAEKGQNGSADIRVSERSGELILQSGRSYAETYRYVSVYASDYPDQFNRMLPSCFSSYVIGTSIPGGGWKSTAYNGGGGGGGGAGGEGSGASTTTGAAGGPGITWKVDDINYCQGGPGGSYGFDGPSPATTKGSGGAGGSVIGGSFRSGTSGQPGMLAIAWKQ